MSAYTDEIRTSWAKGDAIRDAGLTTPRDIIRYDDILYGTDQKWQVLDVYRPKKSINRTLPVIVSVHGGAWVYGDKELYQHYCMSLAQRGFAVVNFTYRLAPEFKFPSSLEDTNLVFEWIGRNKKRYGFDTEHIFAVGDSAGAHLLGVYANFCTNPTYAAGFDFAPAKTPLRAVALNCGHYHAERETMSESTEQLFKELLPKGGTEDELQLISVLEHITPQFPPAFVMTCTDDFLKQDALPLCQTLMAQSVPFEFHFYGSIDNALAHVFHCDMRSKDGAICNLDECRFFKRFC